MAAQTIRLSRPEFGRTAFARSRRAIEPTPPSSTPLPVGLLVMVRNRFEDRWIPGFSVANHEAGRYQLRRCSDGCILPAWFTAEAVRADEH